MATDKRIRHKGRKSGGSFLSIPHVVLNSDAFLSLDGRAVKMLLDIAVQYKGSNNGDLTTTMSFLKSRGWNSNDQIKKARDDLLDRGLIALTRQGRRPKIPSLYSITWRSIDHCGGKLDVPATKVASNEWKEFRFFDHRHTVQSTPPHGAIGGEKVVSLHRLTVQ